MSDCLVWCHLVFVGYVSLTSTVYTEVKLGIRDRRVFQEPDDVTCVKIDNVNNILSAVIKRGQVRVTCYWYNVFAQ